MVETKASADMDNATVVTKMESAKEWCKNASEYLLENDGKRWKYLLIPHDAVTEQNSLENYVQRFERK